MSSPSNKSQNRLYRYVGPAELALELKDSPPGTPICSLEDLRAWRLSSGPRREIIATYIVGEDRVVRLADRHSEHVVCAAGGPVYAAGEMTVSETGVVAVTNQSTGFCPEPDCWAAVEAALDAAGIDHPGGLTSVFVFRKCMNEDCGQRNLVKDGVFECGVCGSELPVEWNFG